MRLLYVINTMDFGGAQSILRYMIKHINRFESNIQVELTTLYTLGCFGEELLELGVPVRSLGARSKYDLHSIPRLVRVVRDGNYDLVHVYLFPAIYIAAFASCFVRRPKWILTEVNIWNRRRRYSIFRLFDAIVYRCYEKVIANSDHVAEALLYWLPNLRPRLVTIPNGLPIPEFVNEQYDLQPGKPVRFLYVGRLEYAKGIDLLIQALSKIENRNFELTIVGDGSQRETLERLVLKHELSHKIRFIGACGNLSTLARSANCLVLPSRWEGLPMVLLEFMALGLPVIASAVGGIPEIIENGVNGFLVPPGDVASLVRQLDAVIENPQSLRRIGERGKQIVTKKYSIQAIAERHKVLYCSLVSY